MSLGTRSSVPSWKGGPVPVGDWTSRLARLIVSLLLGTAIAAWLSHRVPGSAPIDTDIAGYPSAFGFDVEQYFNRYLLWIVVFPGVVLVIYSLAGRLSSLRFNDAKLAITSEVGASDVAKVSSRNPDLSAQALVLVSAFVIAYEVTIVEAGRFSAGLTMLVAMAIGVALVVGVRRWTSAGGQRAHVLGLILCAGAMTSLVLLYFVSGATVQYVDGTKLDRSWLPVWVPLLGVAAMLAWVRRAVSVGDVARRGRSAAIFVTVPVLVFLATAVLPGALPFDYFHDGEQLVGASLLEAGWVPYRDFLSIHGLFFDSLEPQVGFTVFERSFWGHSAGISLIVTPLGAAAVYIALVTMTRRFSWVIPALYVVFAVAGRSRLAGLPTVVHSRLFLLPVVVASMVYLLRSRSRTSIAVFSTSLFLLALLTPEAGPAAVTFAAVLAVAELVRRPRESAWWKEMPATAWCLSIWTVMTLAWFVWLGAVGALDDFFFYFRTFARDHTLTGGIPVQWSGHPFAFAVYFSPAIVLLVMGFVIWRWRSRRSLTDEDWVAVAATLFVAYYYSKFLARADGHVFQPFAAAIVPAGYLLARGLGLLDSFVALALRDGAARRQALSVGVGLSVGVVSMFPFVSSFREARHSVVSAAERYQPVSTLLVTDPLLGTVDPGVLGAAGIRDLRLALAPGGRELSVFDFTNQPALYHFLVDREPLTRYFHVSMAIRDVNQLDLIDELGADPPDVVAFGTSTGGLPSWDGLSNPVRHDRVSEWILRRYKPWIQLRGQTLLQREDLSLPTDQASLGVEEVPVVPADATRGALCDYRQLPSRLSSPTVDHSTAVSAAPVERFVRLSGWVVDFEKGQAVRSVAISVGGELVGLTPPDGSRPDVAEALDLDGDVDVMIDLQVGLVAGETVDDIALWAITEDGRARQIRHDRLGGPSPRSLTFEGAALTVTDDAAISFIENVEVVDAIGGQVDLGRGPQYLQRVDLPLDRTVGSYLSLEFAETLTGDLVAGWTPGSIPQSFTANPLPSTSVTVHAAACPMWHAQRGPALYLELDGPHSIQASLDTVAGRESEER